MVGSQVVPFVQQYYASYTAKTANIQINIIEEPPFETFNAKQICCRRWKLNGEHMLSNKSIQASN